MILALLKRTLPVGALAVFGATLLRCQGVASIVREEQSVTVGSAQESWRLEWRAPPNLVCFPGTDGADWYTCPCAGFRFAERGRLDLVRRRPGAGEERLALTPLFRVAENPAAVLNLDQAVLQRWPVLKADTVLDDPDLASRIRARGLETAMLFADFDRDGRPTEFLLRVGSEPCAHVMSVLVGISIDRSALHVFATVEHPDVPLVLEEPVWDAVLHSPQSAATVVDLRCGDHGSDEMTEVTLRAEGGVLHATRRTYQCTDDDKRGRLLATAVL